MIWRPPKRYRKDSAILSCEVHNQIQQFHPQGLFFFQQPEKPEDRKPALQWPRLSVSPDQGPTCVTAISHWLHKLRINVDVSFDQCHRWHNDLIGALKFAGLGNHLTLALLRVNIPSSPWHQDERLAQARGAFDELLANEGPSTCVLFKEMVHDMLAEKAGQEFASEEDPAQALWNSFATHSCLSKKAEAVVNSRWMRLLRKLDEDSESFHQRKFIYLYTCAEPDMLTTGQVASIVAHGVSIPTVTSARRLTAEELAIKKGSCNQLVMGLMDMLNPDTLRKDKICVAATKAWTQAFGPMNQQLRSCTRSLDWLKNFIDMEFLMIQMLTFSALRQEPVLAHCEFVIPAPGQAVAAGFEHTQTVEDEFAELFAHATLSVVGARTTSSAPMFL